MTTLVERLRELAGQTDAFANNRHHSFVTTQQMARESAAALKEAANEIEKLRRELRCHAHTDEDIVVQNAEIERLRADCERLREFNTKLCTEIDLLRDIVRDVMSELLIAQEDNLMASAGYRGEWIGELIETCQRGLENREAPK